MGHQGRERLCWRGLWRTHTDCTFIRVSGSELVQKYIGEGSRMVRELFVMARCGPLCVDRLLGS